MYFIAGFALVQIAMWGAGWENCGMSQFSYPQPGTGAGFPPLLQCNTVSCPCFPMGCSLPCRGGNCTSGPVVKQYFNKTVLLIKSKVTLRYLLMTRWGPTLEKASWGERGNHSFLPKSYQFFWNLSKKCMDTQGWLAGLFCEGCKFQERWQQSFTPPGVGNYSCCSSKAHIRVTLFKAVPASVTVCAMLYSSPSC